MPLTHLILGDGIAGMSAAQVVRQRRPDDRIVVVSDDPAPFYYRAALTNYLLGQLTESELWALPPDAWGKLRIGRVSGRVERLDAKERLVELADGRTLRYDRLLVATGARARTIADDAPRTPGLDAAGLLVLRRLSDVQALLAALPRMRNAVIVGGGILGLEAASGLRARNVAVTILHRGTQLLDRVLDPRAADLVAQRVQRDGVRTLLGAALAAIDTAKGRVRGVALADGRSAPCDVVIQAIGNVPNTEFLSGTGATLDRGYVVTDSQMAVRGLDGVFAAGDLAVVSGGTLPFRNPGGLWQPARKQGQVAGTNMSHDTPLDPRVDYAPGAIYSATVAWDMPLGSLGECGVEPEGAVVVRHESRRDGMPVYKKAILVDGHVAGVLLLGDRREAQPLRHLMNLRDDAGNASAVADRLFDPSFDLAAWVAAQRRQPGVKRLDATVPVPLGPLPPSRAARDATGNARGFAGSLAETKADAADAGAVLTLVLAGRRHELRRKEVRVGRDAACDLVVADASVGRAEIVFRREGAAWMASSVEGRGVRVERNGRALVRPVAVDDRDAFRLGDVMLSVVLAQAQAPSSSGAPRGWLVGVARHAVRGRAVQLGSAPDNDVVLDAPDVASFHAQVLPVGDGKDAYLVDCGSAAGTFVNDEQLVQPRLLRAGDVVRLGMSTTLQFEGARGDVHAQDDAPATSGGGDVAHLVGWEGRLTGRAIGVRPGSVIGRGGTADVRLDDALLSRSHARFGFASGRWTVTDLGSLNGVGLGGQRIEPGQDVVIAEGAALRIGSGVFRFHAGEPPMDRGVPEPMPTPVDEATRRHQATHAVLEIAGLTNPPSWPLEKDEVVVGSGRTADVVVKLPTVSREHLVIRRRRFAYQVEERGSRTGTTLRGEALRPGEPRTLQDGDVLALGQGLELRFRIVAQPVSETEGGGFATTGAAGTPAFPGEADRRSSSPSTGGGAATRGAGGTPALPGAARASSSMHAGAAAQPDGLTLALRTPDGRLIEPRVLEGDGPFVIGKDAERVSYAVALPGVSRVHAELAREGDGFALRDLGSRTGTTLGGRSIGTETVPVRDGDAIGIGGLDILVRFVWAAQAAPRAREVVATPAVSGSGPTFRVDWSEIGDPLQGDFSRHVRDELDSCIGCHECMRACPLPDAKDVGIAALNAAVAGLGLSDKASRFVADCTQCQACVPVCPVDIHRSHLVLWNKLKAQPDPARPMLMQVGSEAVESTWTVGRLAAHLADHPLLSKLGTDETRGRFIAQCRLRRLQPGETLLREGEFAGSAWLVLDGTLDVGMSRADDRVESMIALGPGQVVGLDTLLADQSSTTTVTAREAATLVGMPKYPLQRAMAESGEFAAVVKSHALGVAAETLLKRVPFLRSVEDADLHALLQGLAAEGHEAGRVISEAHDAERFLFLVRRGFVAEIRAVDGKERVANYLGAGQAFGGPCQGSATMGTLVRYEAATHSEVLFVSTEALHALARQHASLGAALGRLEAATKRPAEAALLMSPHGKAVAQGSGVMLIDTRSCVDCNNCVDACERRHGTSRLVRTGRQMGPWQVPAACFHCEDPVCLFCAVDGIVRLPTGEIRIVEDNCIGCGACAERCPYDNIVMAPREKVEPSLAARWLPGSLARWLGVSSETAELPDHARIAVKCDLCAGHDDGPACVRSCPVDAAIRVAKPEQFFHIDAIPR